MRCCFQFRVRTRYLRFSNSIPFNFLLTMLLSWSFDCNQSLCKTVLVSSQTWKATRKSRHEKLVAVKIPAEDSRQGDSDFLNEVNLLSRVDHVNLVHQGSTGDHIHGDILRALFARIQSLTSSAVHQELGIFSTGELASKLAQSPCMRQQHPSHVTFYGRKLEKQANARERTPTSSYYKLA